MDSRPSFRALIEMASQAETAPMEKFWIDPDSGEVEHVQDYEEMGSIIDNIGDGWVRGGYSRADQHFFLEARDVRSLALALRFLMRNHDSAKGMHYDISKRGEVIETGTLDYAGMMGLRMSGRMPPEKVVQKIS